MSANSTTPEAVLLYAPNLIGYVRILFMCISFYFHDISWKITVTSYFLAFFGDVVDGYVARALNQSSKYGGILDMVTDRVSTCGFLMILSRYYTDYSFVFMMLVALDLFSHWMHVMR